MTMRYLVVIVAFLLSSGCCTQPAATRVEDVVIPGTRDSIEANPLNDPNITIIDGIPYIIGAAVDSKRETTVVVKYFPKLIPVADPVLQAKLDTALALVARYMGGYFDVIRNQDTLQRTDSTVTVTIYKTPWYIIVVLIALAAGTIYGIVKGIFT